MSPDSDQILTAVNTFWYSSLVLSIGAAVTGMLAMTWRQAVLYVRLILRSNATQTNLSVPLVRARKTSYHGTSVFG